MDKSDRAKSQDIMVAIMSCETLDELDTYLKSVRERVTELSTHEAVAAIRSSSKVRNESKEWQLLLGAIRQHLLTIRSPEDVKSLLRGLDTPYEKTIW
jgi:hypothetical protein